MKLFLAKRTNGRKLFFRSAMRLDDLSRGFSLSNLEKYPDWAQTVGKDGFSTSFESKMLWLEMFCKEVVEGNEVMFSILVLEDTRLDLRMNSKGGMSAAEWLEADVEVILASKMLPLKNTPQK